MKRYTLMVTAMAVLLAGCGKLENAESAEMSSQGSEKSSAESIADDSIADESVADDTEVTGDETKVISTDDVRASTSSVNLYGDDLRSRIPAAKEFYDLVMQAKENTEISEMSAMTKVLNVGFNVGGEEYILAYTANNVFAWAQRSDSAVKHFKPDDETSSQLRDMMLTYSALGYVLEDENYTVSPEHYETHYITDLAAEISDPYCEVRTNYIDERTSAEYIIQTDGSSKYYLQRTDERTDAVIDDAPYYQDLSFYEYFTDGSGKSYCRYDSDDVYYNGDECSADFDIMPLPQDIAENDEYLYSFDIDTESGSQLTVEVWSGSAGKDYLLIENGALKAEWSELEYLGMTLMDGFRTEQAESGEIDEMIAHAEEHLVKKDTMTQDEMLLDNEGLLEYDTVRYHLFDLSDIEVGREVEPTGVVEEWRDYISSSDKPYTLEFRWAGAGRNEYQLSTTDGKNFYYRHDMEIHENDPGEDLGSEEWLVDDRLFQAIYKTAEYPVRDAYEYPLSDYDETPRLVSDLLFENEKYDEDYAGSCVRAYEVTVGGEQYICEEWSLYLDRLWKVYIKDGNIVAWEGDFYNEPTVNTVIRLEKTAETDLIQIPQDASVRTFID